jgi:hypothetical protein
MAAWSPGQEKAASAINGLESRQNLDGRHISPPEVV